MLGWSRRESPRLLDESIQPPPVALALPVAPRPHSPILAACHHFYRQVLLDRDQLIEIGVPGEIRNAEAALPEYTLDGVPVQAVLRLQRVGIGLVIHRGTACGCINFV